MEKNKKKIIVVGILLTLLVTIGTSYAWWTSTAVQTGINEIQSDCLDLKIQNESDAIFLPYAYPLTDEEAKKVEPYKFTIKNTCNTIVNYTIKLEKLQKENEEVLNSDLIAVEFNNGQKQILSDYPSSTTQKIDGYNALEARDLIKGTLTGGQEKNYQIKLWMDEHVTAEEAVMDKIFRSKIVIDGGMNNVADYTEPILHGADPVLESTNAVAMLTANEVAEETPTTTDKLIPVIIDETSGNVTRANIKEDWYNYEEKRWANAVILVDNAKANEIKPGDKIDESQIESYFVWIPKYRYKLFDENMGRYETASDKIDESKQNKAIEIEFGITDTENNAGKQECVAPGSGEDGECKVNMWMTHPAFTAFSGSKGMWVGKFETSDAGNQSIQIKPNAAIWRNINVANAFQTSYEYQRSLESHMMKNTEWGAVAYLTQSIYGMCSKGGSGTICTEIAINSNNSYTTGYNNTNGVYPKSKDASTTGNNTGIFDMSGGAWEYMASTMYQDGNKEIDFASSDLNLETLKDKKYYDVYNYGTDMTHWNRRILGDATGEMGPFQAKDSYYVSSYFDDWAIFVYSNFPWFIRGGYYGYGSHAGIFSSFRVNGGVDSARSFRIVLAP